MSDHTEVKSENARNVILSYAEEMYFVNKVNVQILEGKEKLKAVFHARRVADNEPRDVSAEISQNVYDVLVEYTKMNKFDLILVLRIDDDGNDAKWCLMSENWLKKQASMSKKTQYIV